MTKSKRCKLALEQISHRAGWNVHDRFFFLWFGSRKSQFSKNKITQVCVLRTESQGAQAKAHSEIKLTSPSTYSLKHFSATSSFNLWLHTPTPRKDPIIYNCSVCHLPLTSRRAPPLGFLIPAWITQTLVSEHFVSTDPELPSHIKCQKVIASTASVRRQRCVCCCSVQKLSVSHRVFTCITFTILPHLQLP